MTRETTELRSTKAQHRKKTTVALELEYRLSELPSAQHRAGLAGLVLLVQWLEQHGKARGICKITKLDQYSAVIQLDRKGLDTLFDELFAATWRTRKHPDNVRDAVPNGAFLTEYDPSGEERLWLSLWQEVVLTILRNKARNRLPFVARAEGRETNAAEKYWGKLQANSTEKLSGTYLLGARAKNAEQVPFLTTAHLKFLLHFWPLVIWIYRLALLDKDEQLELSSYLIAIPDVLNLQLFCEVFPALLRQRSTEKIGAKILRESLVSIPTEASLEALSKMKEQLLAQSFHASLEQAVLGLEVVQVDRTKHDIAIQDFRRLTGEPTLIEEYSLVQATTTNRLFRRQQVSNLVSDVPAWFGFIPLFCRQPVKKTFDSYTFRQDSRSLYEQYIGNNTAMPTLNQSDVSETDEFTEIVPRQAPTSMEEAVYEIVRTYLNRKVSIKEKLSWKEIKHDKQQRTTYNEKKRDLARAAFFSIRSRSGEDFVEYFTTTLCSVSQQLSEQGFLRIAHSLYEEPEKVRTLTLLALSAQA